MGATARPGADFFHYLPVTDRDMQLGLYVTGAGRCRIPAGRVYPPEGHPGLYDFSWAEGRVLPEFQVILIMRGSGDFESRQTGRIRFRPGTLILLFPGVWHRYRPHPATGWTERWISVNGEFPHRMTEQGLIAPARPVAAVKAPTQLAAAFDRTLERVHAEPARQSPLVLVGAIELLTLAAEFVAGPGPARGVAARENVGDPLVAGALDLIWTQSHRQITVAQIAERLGANRRTLERRVAAALGRSVLDEIHVCRLSRARRLLVETNLPVKTIAYLAGFSDSESLRRLMRVQEGCSPAEFRQRDRRAGAPTGRSL